MKVILEVSRPHYHPGPKFDTPVTKKRDLSIPPNWVANERIEKDGVSFAIVMPPREEELYETEQAVHIHLPEYIWVKLSDGQLVLAKVKIEPSQFTPRVHFDEQAAAKYSVKNGDKASV